MAGNANVFVWNEPQAYFCNGMYRRQDFRECVSLCLGVGRE